MPTSEAVVRLREAVKRLSEEVARLQSNLQRVHQLQRTLAAVSQKWLELKD